ncbi:MAG: hypothetical protein M1816_005072 [Peltula sp. TS41687]|nr:MAG: hypothetical protein M1816_005072 [Peltula sp. TS41687]
MATIESEAQRTGRTVLNSSSDYPEMVNQLMGRLKAIEDWPFIGGVERAAPELLKDTDEDDKSEYVKQEVEREQKKEKLIGMAMPIIMDSVSKNQKQHIKNVEDPRKMWEALKGIHTRPDEQKLAGLIEPRDSERKEY